jgi:hypothetical protein
MVQAIKKKIGSFLTKIKKSLNKKKSPDLTDTGKKGFPLKKDYPTL